LRISLDGVSVSGEVVKLTRNQMHALVQADAELSEVLMTAFISRRIELVTRGIGDVLLIGSAQSTATFRIKVTGSMWVTVRWMSVTARWPTTDNDRP
jgi:hypothetical protein